MSTLKFLEELRAIAHMGLNYTKDPYDRERYNRLLQLAAQEYSPLAGIEPDHVVKQFKKELGYITPKIGVDAAIFSEDGKILFVKRADDHRWCMPCGWAEVNETPIDSVKREVREETGLIIEVGQLIDIFWRLPGEFDQPHTAYFLLFHCIETGGELTTTAEALEVAYYHPPHIQNWHRDHKKRADRAYQYWLAHLSPTTSHKK
jgi:ADP-ribose pyrophosphatase YjhB (NUDIX family)